WADATSLQLLDRMLADTEESAVLLLLTSRHERDHASWGIKETAAREFPHRMREVQLEALTGEFDRELLHALVGSATLPAQMEERIIRTAEGNPFFLEEIIRSLVDAGALAPTDSGWRLDHDVPVEIPATVEKVILARIDRLPESDRRVLTAASALGRQFGLPLLEAVAPGN